MIKGESHTLPDSFWVAFNNAKASIKKAGDFKKPLSILTLEDKVIIKECSDRVGRQRVEVSDKSLDLDVMRELGRMVK